MNSRRWLWGLLHFKLSAQSIKKKKINIYGCTRKKAYVNIYVCLYIHGSKIKRNGIYFKIEETIAESQKSVTKKNTSFTVLLPYTNMFQEQAEI